jgi:hypothetical protein
MFFSSVRIAFINENTEGYLEKAGLLKLTRDICIKRGTVPGNTGRIRTLYVIILIVLHGITFQKKKLFITTTVRTLNPTILRLTNILAGISSVESTGITSCFKYRGW